MEPLKTPPAGIGMQKYDSSQGQPANQAQANPQSQLSSAQNSPVRSGSAPPLGSAPKSIPGPVSSSSPGSAPASSPTSSPGSASALVNKVELANIKDKVILLKRFLDARMRINLAVKQKRIDEAKELYQVLVEAYQKLLKISNYGETNRLHADITSTYALISEASSSIPIASQPVHQNPQAARSVGSVVSIAQSRAVPIPVTSKNSQSINHTVNSGSALPRASSSQSSSRSSSPSLSPSSSPSLSQSVSQEESDDVESEQTGIGTMTSSSGLMANSGIKGVKKSHIIQEEVVSPHDDQKKKRRMSVVTTDFDLIIQLLEEKKKLSLTEIENRFNISRALAEEWVQILADNGLIEIRYLPIGGIEVRKIQ